MYLYELLAQFLYPVNIFLLEFFSFLKYYVNGTIHMNIPSIDNHY